MNAKIWMTIFFYAGLQASEPTPKLPIMLNTPEEARSWLDMSGRIKAISAEANERVNAAQKEAAEIRATFEQKMTAVVEAAKQETDADVRRTLEAAFNGQIEALNRQYSTEKKQLEEQLTNEFDEREHGSKMKRLYRNVLAMTVGSTAVGYTLVHARREVAAITRALHQDELINWRHDVALSAIKRIAEQELAKQLVAFYFSSPEIIKKISPATPIARVLQAVNERVAQLQTYIGWQNHNFFIRRLVGIDSRMIPVVQERLVRLYIMRDVLLGYKS